MLSHGYHIAWHRGGPKGAYQPHKRRISLQLGMPDEETLCTLAHEVGHLVHGHPAPATEKQEIKSHIWAAKKVIDARKVFTAAKIYPDSSDMIAHEVGVTVHLLRIWCSIANIEMSRKTDTLHR